MMPPRQKGNVSHTVKTNDMTLWHDTLFTFKLYLIIEGSAIISFKRLLNTYSFFILSETPNLSSTWFFGCGGHATRQRVGIDPSLASLLGAGAGIHVAPQISSVHHWQAVQRCVLIICSNTNRISVAMNAVGYSQHIYIYALSSYGGPEVQSERMEEDIKFNREHQMLFWSLCFPKCHLVFCVNRNMVLFLVSLSFF